MSDPDVLVAGGLVSPDSRVVQLLGWLATRLYRRVDRIVVLGEDMRELIVARLARDADKVQVIRNWADTFEIAEVPCETTLIASLQLSAKFVVQFAGNMGRTHDLRSLAEAAERLQDLPDVHFLLMGWGARRDWLEARVRDAGIRNVSLLPHQPRAQLADALNACHLAVVPMVAGMKGLSVPSRMYNIMAAGKPILAIAESGSELATTILDEDIGWVVEPGRVDRLVEAIREAREDRDRLGAMGRRARDVAVRK